MTGLEEAYLALKGSRLETYGSELIIPDFTERDYEDMLDYCLEVLAEYRCIRGDYYQWLYERAVSYHKLRLRQRHCLEFVDPLLSKHPEQYTTREQLTCIKFYLYRRHISAYRLPSEKGELG